MARLTTGKFSKFGKKLYLSNINVLPIFEKNGKVKSHFFNRASFSKIKKKLTLLKFEFLSKPWENFRNLAKKSNSSKSIFCQFLKKGKVNHGKFSKFDEEIKSEYSRFFVNFLKTGKINHVQIFKIW